MHRLQLREMFEASCLLVERCLRTVQAMNSNIVSSTSFFGHIPVAGSCSTGTASKDGVSDMVVVTATNVRSARRSIQLFSLRSCTVFSSVCHEW